MFKKMFALVAAAMLVGSPIMAEDDHAGHGHEMKAKQKTMSEMMKGMGDCTVCSVMLPHMDALGPSMKCEFITLNNGMAMLHTVDAAQVELFHKVGDKMHQAGAEAMKMDDVAAGKALCQNCQQFRDLVVAGAKMSHGKTETGDIMMFTSDDVAVQEKIAEVEVEWRKMTEMMQAG